MSRIDDLIAQHSPGGVEFKALGEVAQYSASRVDASELDHTNFVGVDNLVADKGGKVDASYLPNTARLTAYRANDILIGNIRPYLKKVWLATNPGGCSGDVLAVHITDLRVDAQFLYYLLSADGFFAYNMLHSKGAKMPRGNKDAIMRYRIPVPPLEVQREIVRILDTFTELEAELEAELKARRQQYEYYRKRAVQTAHTGNSFSLRALEESGVLKLGRGKVISRGDLDAHPGDFPVYSSSGLGTGEFGRYGLYMFDDERITWSIDGGGRFFYRSPHRYSVTNVSGWMTTDGTVLRPRYAYYALTVQWEQQSFDYTRKAHPSVIRDVYSLDIPSLYVQDRVIADLGQFDALVNDLSVGLPAELTARRQQYEYYRDRLLTFDEAPHD